MQMMKQQSTRSGFITWGNATHQRESTVSVSLFVLLSSTRLPSSVMLLPEQSQSMKKSVLSETRGTCVLGQTIEVKSSECGVVFQ